MRLGECPERNDLNKIAFVTYNTVGRGLSNGWHESDGRSALVLQNSTGAAWFAKQDSRSPVEASQEADRVSNEIDRLWGELQNHLDELDHIVIYVGADGSEQAIKLASQLPPSKVTFVACDCGLSHKTMLIAAHGMIGAGRQLCECGGRETMRALFARFMATGEVRHMIPAYA